MEPSKKRISLRLLCINCKICITINTMRRYPALQLGTRVVSLVSRWISPVLITEEDYICEECFVKSMQIINAQTDSNNEIDPYAGPSHRGHAKVCLVCGRSLQSRQSHCILKENTTALTLETTKLIQNTLEPRQISQTDCVCHACWVRFQRKVLSTQPELRKSIAKVNKFEGVSKKEEETSLDENVPPIIVIRSTETQTEPYKPEKSSDITLLNYRRAPNTNNRCVFFGCKNVRLHGVSDEFRAAIVYSYNFYIPKKAKICSDHLRGNSWNLLYSSANSMTDFTADMVEHVFSFVNAFKAILDFSNVVSVQEMDENLFEFWMGLTKSQFLSLLEELPGLIENQRGILGLAAILIKMHTGYTDVRISILLDVPRSTLERIMKSVTEILLQNLFPGHLDGDNLTREQLIERIGIINSQ